MTTPLYRFLDVQAVLVDELEALVGTGHTGVETPANLADVLPFVRIRRTGGPSDRLNDYASIDIDVFAALYTAAELLAERVRQHLCGPPPPVSTLDRIDCDIGPRELPWGDGTVRRWGASYSVVSRRHTVLV